jgi:hypothetical protein
MKSCPCWANIAQDKHYAYKSVPFLPTDFKSTLSFSPLASRDTGISVLIIYVL